MFLKKVLFLTVLLMLLLVNCIHAAGDFDKWEKIHEVRIPKMKLVQTPDNVVGFLNETFGMMVGYFGESWVTSDGGRNWRKAESNPNLQANRYGLEILDQNKAWSCGDYAEVVTTNNGAASWEQIGSFEGANLSSSRYLSFIDTSTGWIASPYKLGMTTDGGNHWSKITLPSGIKEISAIALQSKDTGYIFDMSQGGYLYVTRDSGATWVKRRIGMQKKGYPALPAHTRPVAAMRFSNAPGTKSHGLIVLNIQGGSLWELTTSDGGETWRQGPVPGKNGSLFLAPDGKTLTICDFDNVITVLRRNSVE